MKYRCILLVLLLFNMACARKTSTDSNKEDNVRLQRPKADVYITVLGIAQDAGMPHINYDDEFLAFAKEQKESIPVTALGLINKKNNTKYLFEATPDLPRQLYELNGHLTNTNIIDGIFLTHAHIGHYTGLMYLGREAMGAKSIPVFAMPRMRQFLETNGPWDQLVALNNIQISPLRNEIRIFLDNTSRLSVTPFLVPHRDEYSETVGYRIDGPNKSALFIPDINKWHLWDKDIVEEVKAVDFAFVDATFFGDGELTRPMSEIPHPFVEETVARFQDTDVKVKNKIIFIHFNHSNPAMNPSFDERIKLEKEGFRFAEVGQHFPL